MKVSLRDLKSIYELEVRKNVKNKEKIFKFETQKLEYLLDIKRILENNLYDGGKYNIFLVYKPKIRVVMSQSIYDKVINHYVSRFILIPKLSKYLNNRNCATRKNMGIDYAIKIFKKDIESFKKYKEFYFLKLDISKFFYSIDHNVLQNLIKEDLTDEEYNLVNVILDSTNRKYVNVIINNFENKIGSPLPKYDLGKGLPIGNMTSQFLAIFYLSKLQHYMIHNLHLKFVNYMDDYIIIHQDKKYLKNCLNIITSKLYDEYNLLVNKNKTYIASSKNGVPFLGYNFKVINNKTIIKLSKSSKKNIKKGIKRAKYLYKSKKIDFSQIFSSIENYKHSYPYASKKEVKNIFELYW